MRDSRYALRDPSELLSPGLLIYRGLVRQNLQAMIAMARGADRLRPHVKTHKMAEIVRMAESMGIRKHKCATLAEAEMVAAAGGTDVLLSYPLIGPNLKRFAQPGPRLPQYDVPRDRRSSRLGPRALGRRGGTRPAGPRPRSTWRSAWAGPGSSRARRPPSCTRWWTGCPTWSPTGCTPTTARSTTRDVEERRKVDPGRDRPRPGAARPAPEAGQDVPRLVLGGTPTFPIHAELDVPGVECSPGHDHAPRPRLFHAVSGPAVHAGGPAADPGDQPAASGPALPRPRPQGRRRRPVRPPRPVPRHRRRPTRRCTARSTSSSRRPTPTDSPIGTPLLAIPTHVCPTVALHRRAYVIEDGELVGPMGGHRPRSRRGHLIGSVGPRPDSRRLGSRRSIATRVPSHLVGVVARADERPAGDLREAESRARCGPARRTRRAAGSGRPGDARARAAGIGRASGSRSRSSGGRPSSR